MYDDSDEVPPDERAPLEFVINARKGNGSTKCWAAGLDSLGSGRPEDFSSEGNWGAIRRDGLDFGEFHEQLLDSALLMRLGQADLFHARIVTHGVAKEKLFLSGRLHHLQGTISEYLETLDSLCRHRLGRRGPIALSPYPTSTRFSCLKRHIAGLVRRGCII